MKRTFEHSAAKNISTPVGDLGLCAKDGYLVAITFQSVEEAGRDAVLTLAEGQLREYFAGKRQEFDIPLDMGGTEFQRRVWKALMEIPYGKICTYSDIALRVGSPKGVRAVGMANHVNRLPIVIPCHRVVGKDGGLTGYAGGLEMKEWLLELESKNK